MDKKGVTAVELMVVLGVIAIIAVLAIPNLGEIQQRARIRAAAQGLAQDFRLLRTRALTRSITHEVAFDGVNVCSNCAVCPTLYCKGMVVIDSRGM